MSARPGRLTELAEPVPLAGFWMGGFEGADHVNGGGEALDMAAASGHIEQLEEDHARAAEAGLRCIRESIGWRLAESADGAIDLARAERIARSAARHGLQVLWTVMHYGVPGDLSLHDDALIDRFARFAAEVARVLGRAGAAPAVYTPVNEISYLAWAASQPDLLGAPNHAFGADAETARVAGYAVKRRLVRACLAAMAAMRSADPRARFLHVEPVVHVVAPRDRPDLNALAEEIRGYQWQTWDLLAGRSEPALGGHPAALDLLGVNHYHSSQWEVGTERRLAWHLRDPRRLPLSALLAEVWQRYRRPLLVAETGHIGAGRAAWLNEIAAEVRRARDAAVPVHGICLYPLVDRPDWNETSRWHRSGLWHVDHDAAAAPPLARTADRPYLAALRAWRSVLPQPARAEPQRVLLAFLPRRWDPPGHRAEQLLSRLAGRWRVVAVEPPRPCEGPARIDRIAHGPDIEVIVPHLPLRGGDPLSWDAPGLQALLQNWWTGHELPRPLGWLFAPAAAPLARTLQPRSLVRDSDAADAERGEIGVLALPEGVAHAHFAGPRAGGWDAEEARRLQGGIAEPRIGHAGVAACDLDLALLARVAESRPDWQIVIVGALDAIDPGALPQRANLHWLGAQPHRLWPELMAGWRVGILPFRHRSDGATPLRPALELLAAGLPVVASGAAADSIGLPPRTVHVAADGGGFIRACERLLAETADERSKRLALARGVVAERRWDDIAEVAHARLLALCVAADGRDKAA